MQQRHPPRTEGVLSALLGIALCLLVGCAEDSPTGVSRSDVEGLWTGNFDNINLMGRSLTGEFEWQFNRGDFEIQFFNPPEGQAERISGDWKFANQKLVLTLRTSFPIGGDAGATDSLFVSILNNEMSLRTVGGSNILLLKIRSLSRLQTNPGVVSHTPVGRFLPLAAAGHFRHPSIRKNPHRKAFAAVTRTTTPFHDPSAPGRS